MNTVFDKNGHRGRLLGGTGAMNATVELPDGRKVSVPSHSLNPRPEGDYHLAEDFERLITRNAEENASVTLAEETLAVRKEQSENVVRLRKVTQEYEQLLQAPAFREKVEIERVAVNRPVTGPVAARQEGDTLIIPLVEEEIVWEKRLVIREEIRVRKQRIEEQRSERIPLRREELKVERESTEKER